MTFAYVEPHELDFGQLVQALEGANYTLRSIHVEVGGKVVDAAGVTYLELEGTGQRCVLGGAGTGLSGRGRYEVVGWPDGPFKLEAAAVSGGG